MLETNSEIPFLIKKLFIMNNEQQKIELQHHSTIARLPKQKNMP